MAYKTCLISPDLQSASFMLPSGAYIQRVTFQKQVHESIICMSELFLKSFKSEDNTREWIKNGGLRGETEASS